MFKNIQTFYSVKAWGWGCLLRRGQHQNLTRLQAVRIVADGFTIRIVDSAPTAAVTVMLAGDLGERIATLHHIHRTRLRVTVRLAVRVAQGLTLTRNRRSLSIDSGIAHLDGHRAARRKGESSGGGRNENGRNEVLHALTIL